MVLFLQTLAISLVIALVLRSGEWIVRNRTTIRTWFWITLHPRTTIRISVGVLCQIRLEDEYLLIRQSWRRQQLGPIGGAIHVFQPGVDRLLRLSFVLEGTKEDHWGDLNAYALRGTLPASHLLTFQKWLHEDTAERETFEEGIQRELYEEIQLPDGTLDNALAFGSFHRIRNVVEPPRKVSGPNIWQWRYLRVFEFVPRQTNGQALMKLLETQGSSGTYVELVSADDIRAGRSPRGTQIGNHAEFLLAERANRPEMPWRT
ncbi:MAG: hypothetical protein EPN48_15515 [Microbacteriaceae bacterium]|nr:MAG: hypothetical protein EPN48_15515 [Microbacteriaceae bacterium]